MSLTVDKYKTLEFIRENQQTLKKEITFYKVFQTKFNDLYTPYIGVYTDPDKLIKAKGILRKDYCSSLYVVNINGGACHAFVDLKTATIIKNQLTMGKYEYVVKQIKVLVEDVVAFGNDNNVCFKKYKIVKD